MKQAMVRKVNMKLGGPSSRRFVLIANHIGDVLDSQPTARFAPPVELLHRRPDVLVQAEKVRRVIPVFQRH